MNEVSESKTRLTKTVYNWAKKTKQQRVDILDLATSEHLRLNPDVMYHSYSTMNGAHGEKIITFLFKQKPI